MVAAYVCSSCRRELQRRATRLSRPQCFSKATFISLANVVPPTPDDPRSPPSNTTNKSSLPQNPRLEELFTNKDAPAQTGRYSRGRESLVGGGGDDEAAVRLRNLQNLRLHRQPETPSTPPPSPFELYAGTKRLHLDIPQSSLGQISHKSPIHPRIQLRNLLDDPTKTDDEIWRFFVQHLDATDAKGWINHGPQKNWENLGSAFNLMLLRMTKSWNISSNKDQSPSRVAKLLEQIKVMRPAWYLGAIWELLCRAQNASENNVPALDFLLREEIIRLWALMFEHWGRTDLRPVNYHTTGDIDWTGLPDPGKLSFKPVPGGLNRQLEFRVYGHFQKMSSYEKDSLAAAVLVTSDLLCRQLSVLQGSTRFDSDYRPLFAYMIKVVSGSHADKVLQASQAEFTKRDIDPLQITAMLDRMKGAPLRATLAASSESIEAFAHGKVGMTAEQQLNLDAAIAKQIGHRLEGKQTSQIIDIWNELRDNSTSSTTRAPLGNIVYDNLIYAFDKLGRPDLTTDVWNHMIKSGVKPNPDQWRKLLVGRSKNPETMEKVWRHMLAAGIRPDLQAWNARISSHLLWGPDAKQGLLALEEMTRAWFAAIDQMWPSTKPSTRPALSKIGDFPGAPKPNQYTLNTCISGLVKRKFGKQKRVDLIPHVFKWADGLEISPNVVTYNILIGMCIRDGNMEEATEMMMQMGKQNVEPDATTFNIFLDHIFKPTANSMPMSPEEQEEAVVGLFGMIDSANMAKDAQTYSTLIDGLLKVHKNVSGATMVFDAMVKREVQIRPHVWTSFLTYYFQEADEGRGEPNFAAIEALWNRIQSMDGIVDVIFYDRMIEGYARFGEVDRSLHFLKRMAKEAKKPGWPCLTAVVNALLDKGMFDQASEIVHDVENSEGYFPHGIGLEHKKFNPDRNMFWQVVVQAGLRKVMPGQVERDANEGI